MVGWVGTGCLEMVGWVGTVQECPVVIGCLEMVGWVGRVWRDGWFTDCFFREPALTDTVGEFKGGFTSDRKNEN